MVKLYTGRELVPKEYAVLEYNDAVFNSTVNATMFDEQCLIYIRDIDSAEVVNVRLNKIETPYGVAGITDFSTGLKTLLNLHLKSSEPAWKNLCVDITECGGAALFGFIFKAADEKQVPLLLRHSQIPVSLGVDVFINDTLKVGVDDAQLLGKVMAFMPE